jgi:outer membrane receptor protein involved in Fe transport
VVKVGTPPAGSARSFLAAIDLGMVERIEIVRGVDRSSATRWAVSST